MLERTNAAMAPHRHYGRGKNVILLVIAATALDATRQMRPSNLLPL